MVDSKKIFSFNRLFLQDLNNQINSLMIERVKFCFYRYREMPLTE